MNPFDVTKAVDYSDQELFYNWVDFPKKSFQEFIRPTLEMPMIIVGSKGSGKTHIMKHFSYSMQKIRSEKTFDNILKEGYLGVYLRCSGLNGYRFSGRNESEETWNSVFAYYLDLWLSQLFLDVINNIFVINKDLKRYEDIVCKKILKLFSNNKEKITDICELIDFLKFQQKNIDHAINNISLSSQELSQSVEILSNPGDLIFEIPNIITSTIPELSNIKILFLLDEYENFSSGQQRYFNTLIRERKNPVCFKIGARRYGLKTTETLSADEHIKAGSEYELFDLDNIFRENYVEYKEFLKNICIKRIDNSQIKISTDITKYFNHSNLSSDFEIIKGKRIHVDKFITKLKKYKIKGINEIVKNVVCDNVLIERLNIYIIYRGIKKGENLIEISNLLKECSQQYANGHDVKMYDVILDKFKQDLIDALYRENGLKLTSYCGFDNLVKISNGIPRHFLMIMKHIFRWNTFYENDFSNETVSTEIQLLAIKDTVLWFMEDANKTDENTNYRYSIESICNFLRELRFSDLPPECSISTFEIKNVDFNLGLKKIITFLEQYSYIIKEDYGRRDKNSNVRNDMYQINGLLACWWELSISRRGIVKLSSDQLEKIFYYNRFEELKIMITNELLKYNVPFRKGNNVLELFD